MLLRCDSRPKKLGRIWLPLFPADSVRIDWILFQFVRVLQS
jgi:hypothetical protein